MNGNIGELIAALTEKRDSLRSVQAILEEENELIVGLDAKGLDATRSGKEEFFRKSMELDNRCLSALWASQEELGLPRGSNLSVLIANARQPEQATLRALKDEIFTAAKINEQLIELNKGLLETSLSFVDRSLRFFARFLTSGGTYGEGGRMMDTPSGGRLVCKEI